MALGSSNTPKNVVQKIRGVQTNVQSPGYVLGRMSSGSGSPELIPLQQLVNQAISMAGGSLGNVSVSGLPSIADGDILANKSGGTAVPVAQTISDMLDYVFGSTQGNILTRSASAWTILAEGAANTILTGKGAGANIAYQTLSALLDAVLGSTQGSVIYRGASTWAALGPGTVGQSLISGGAAANPSWGAATGGAGGLTGLYAQIMSATPTQSGMGFNTSLGTAGFTKTDAATGINILGTTNANIQGVYKAAPATPYRARALVAFNAPGQGNTGAGIGWTDGTKLEVLRWQYSAPPFILVDKWTNSTTAAGNDATINNYWVPPLVWFSLKDDGTTVTFDHSMDGSSWDTIFSVAKASGFLGASGYSNIFFGCRSNTGNGNATLMSYDEH